MYSQCTVSAQSVYSKPGQGIALGRLHIQQNIVIFDPIVQNYQHSDSCQRKLNLWKWFC